MVNFGLMSALILAAAAMHDARTNGSLERGSYPVNHIATLQ